MAITKLKTNSLKNPQRYTSFLGGNQAYGGPASFESIATITPSGVSTITFSSIPATYKSLQIRISALSNGGSLLVRANGDTGSNYDRHALYAQPPLAVSTYSAANTNLIYVQPNGGGITTPDVAVVDVIDYASTSKYKTFRMIAGTDANASYDGSIWLLSGLWRSTSAITSLTFESSSNPFLTGSTFALYGVN